MSRKRTPAAKPTIPDSKYNNAVVTKFITRMMVHGRKSTCQRIIYQAIASLEGKSDKPGLEMFLKALENVKPVVEVKSRRVGGATYQVPVEVRTVRRQALGIRWIISAARERNEKTMTERLSGELLDASNNRGNAVKKREDTHRMAEANRAFSHYRW
jgi:small subunit ribosomal protein S7